MCILGAPVTWSYGSRLQTVIYQGITVNSRATLDIFKRNTGIFGIYWLSCKLLTQSSLHFQHYTTLLHFFKSHAILVKLDVWQLLECGTGNESGMVHYDFKVWEVVHCPTSTCIPVLSNYDYYRVKFKISFFQFICIFFFKWLFQLFGPMTE